MAETALLNIIIHDRYHTKKSVLKLAVTKMVPVLQHGIIITTYADLRKSACY